MVEPARLDGHLGKWRKQERPVEVTPVVLLEEFEQACDGLTRPTSSELELSEPRPPSGTQLHGLEERLLSPVKVTDPKPDQA